MSEKAQTSSGNGIKKLVAMTVPEEWNWVTRFQNSLFPIYALANADNHLFERTTQNKEAGSHYTSGEGSKPGLHSESQTTGQERAVQFSTALKPRS